MSRRQNVTGENATQTKSHRTRRHADKMLKDKTPLKQNATWTKYHRTKPHAVKMSHGKVQSRQNITGQDFSQKSYNDTISQEKFTL